MIHMCAASYKEGIPVIRTKHCVYNEEAKAIIRGAIKGLSFYYPTDLGKYLWEYHGIETSIKAHSGRTVVNGEYVEDMKLTSDELGKLILSWSTPGDK